MAGFSIESPALSVGLAVRNGCATIGRWQRIGAVAKILPISSSSSPRTRWMTAQSSWFKTTRAWIRGSESMCAHDVRRLRRPRSRSDAQSADGLRRGTVGCLPLRRPTRGLLAAVRQRWQNCTSSHPAPCIRASFGLAPAGPGGRAGGRCQSATRRTEVQANWIGETGGHAGGPCALTAARVLLDAATVTTDGRTVSPDLSSSTPSSQPGPASDYRNHATRRSSRPAPVATPRPRNRPRGEVGSQSQPPWVW